MKTAAAITTIAGGVVLGAGLGIALAIVSLAWETPHIRRPKFHFGGIGR